MYKNPIMNNLPSHLEGIMGNRLCIFSVSATLFKYYIIISLLILSTSIFIPPRRASGESLKVDVVSPLIRVFPTTPPKNKSRTSIEIWSARNEYESTQIVLQANKEVTVDDVLMSELTNMKNGAIISIKNFSYAFPEYVFIGKHTPETPLAELDGVVPGLYPDPLEKKPSLRFSGTRSIWLTWYVPQNTMPGDYEGQVLVHTSGDLLKIPVVLHVWNFTLPEKPSLYVTNWLHDSKIEFSYQVQRGSKSYWDIVEKIANDMQAHRQSVIFTPLNLIRMTEYYDGTYEFDFRDYEKWIEIFKKNRFQVFEGSRLDQHESYYIRRPVGLSFKRLDFSGSQLNTAAGQKYLTLLLQALYQENIKLGIQDRYLQHIFDEAGPEKTHLYQEIAALVRRAMPGVTIIDTSDMPEEKRTGMMDIPVTLIGRPVGKTPTGPHAKWGKWWYTSVSTKGKYPNRFIDYPLMKSRMIPWISWREGMTGYLQYGYNWWYTPSGKSPWEDVEQTGKYPPGDGFIVYPSRNRLDNAPVSSLRWEAFRDGMEDYEYLTQLEKGTKKMQEDGERTAPNSECKMLREQAVGLLKEIHAKLISAENYPRDYQSVELFRFRMGAVLNNMDQCVGKN